MSEEWREIPGYEGSYQVSDQGRVRSMDRKISRGNHFQHRRGQVLVLVAASDGYLRVGLYCNRERETASVHGLVLLAFVGPRPEGMECHHLDSQRTNNVLTNLCWGTHLENMRESVRIGTHMPTATRTQCAYGHPFDEKNTAYAREGGKRCRQCRHDRNRQWRARKRAQREAEAVVAAA